jgi:hypothetical protein
MSIYSVHPGISMVQSSIRKIQERTGKTVENWMVIIKKDGPAGEAARREWLKKTHGFGTNYAWWLAELSVGKGRERTDPAAYLEAAEGWVEAMFAGKRAALGPIYDTLLKLAFALGKDVKACPGQTIVPLYRHHVFAEIKPATNTRIDLGFALGDRKATGRLVDTAKKNRISHRIPITSMSDVDDEVKRWLRVAYEDDAT